MRASVMLGDNVNMTNVKEVVDSLLEGLDNTGFKFQRTVPGKPFIIEVNLKTEEDRKTVYDRAIERW